MEAGMKIYLKFNTRFFENKNVLGTAIGSTYYDGAFGKNSNQPTLGNISYKIGEKNRMSSVRTHTVPLGSEIQDLFWLNR